MGDGADGKGGEFDLWSKVVRRKGTLPVEVKKLESSPLIL